MVSWKCLQYKLRNFWHVIGKGRWFFSITVLFNVDQWYKRLTMTDVHLLYCFQNNGGKVPNSFSQGNLKAHWKCQEQNTSKRTKTGLEIKLKKLNFWLILVPRIRWNTCIKQIHQYVSLCTYLLSDQSPQYSAFQESVKTNWKAWKPEFWMPYFLILKRLYCSQVNFISGYSTGLVHESLLVSAPWLYGLWPVALVPPSQ